MHVLAVDDAKDVAGDAAALQFAKGLQHALVRGACVPVGAEAVVQFLRPVHAEADKKGIFAEKIEPCLVEQGAIGLDAVEDLAPGRPVLALEFHDAAKIVQPQYRRFAAMP